jgi:ribonuclease HI
MPAKTNILRSFTEHLREIEGWQVRYKEGRGVFHNHKGSVKIEYVLGISTATNNEVDALAMFQGLTILANKGVHVVAIIGNYVIIIRALHQ